MDLFFYFSLQMASSAKKTKFMSTCGVCDLSTRHLHKHTLGTHVPWYMSSSTACVDCQNSEGFGKDRDRFHRGHKLIGGKNLFFVDERAVPIHEQGTWPEFLH